MTTVRRGFHGYSTFCTPRWYATYPRAWRAAAITTTAWWVTRPWRSTYAYAGVSGEPITYSYGDTVVYEGDTVYYGEEPVATATEYYEQAVEIASSDQTPQNTEWEPLGVYSIVEDDQSRTDKVLQLAVNPDGAIRGNIYDEVLGTASEVEGAVDAESQRVAVRIAGQENPVLEVGFWNLSQDSATVLIHFNAEKVERRGIVRLQEEAQEEPAP